jgi:CSLREA domain-containing protein/uncharacterized repeat protein (TIGR01451 family)
MQRVRLLYLLSICTVLFAITQVVTMIPTHADVKNETASNLLNMPIAPAATFIVNSADDHNDTACTAGDCTLREAINAANANAGTDVINFAIGSGAQTINLTSALPLITGAVTINGATQPGFAGTPLIELNGTSAGESANGLHIFASNCVVRGLVINRFGLQGISLLGSSNTIVGNYLGTNAAGNTGGSFGNGENGVLISSPSNIIGGTATADRNVISGNLGNGVLILNGGASANQVLGNYIGTNATGTVAVANLGDGISIIASPNNIIGGSTPGAGNVISGNANGIHITDSTAVGNLIMGNFIGTDFNGLNDVGNQFAGIDISFEGASNTIGGSASGERNIISGNGTGVLMVGTATGNLVRGNLIGLKGDGVTPLPNDSDGIRIAFSSINNIIGGTSTGQGNRAAFNRANGIFISSSATGNSIQGNSIFSNDLLGINLVAGADPANGVTPNDSGDGDVGANDLQNFPILTASSSLAGGGVNIQGSLNSNPGTTFRLEFFYSAACDPAGNGEGQTFVGFTNVTTNGSGNVSFNENFATSVPGGSAVTATATRTASPFNTSEFSPCFTSTSLADLTITKTASPNPVTVGSNITFTLTAINNGPDAVTSAVVTDNLPASVAFVSCNATNSGLCGGSGNNRLITFPTLAAGATATITIVAKVDCALAHNSTISNTATISSAVTDPVANNSATSVTTVSHPAPQISPTSQDFAIAGGTGNISVTFPAGCGWTAVSNETWITINSGSSGLGNGMVTYTVAANGTGSPRSGTVTVAGLTFTVNQSVMACSYSLPSTSASFNPSAGMGSFEVIAPGGCSWKAISNVPWIQITTGNLSGNGTATFTIDNNAAASPRSGTITVEGLTFTVFQGITFLDVPVGHPFYNEIGKLSARSVTLGCGDGNYCPDATVTREQMAAFIMRALGEFSPPPPAMQRFDDVPPTHPFYAFIDRMAVLQITLGCSANPPLYCPINTVSREQMAAFIIRALHEPGYIPPPPASQRFNDVPPENPFYAHIEEMAVRGITLGCSANPPLYCPTNTVTRAQMAAFLVRAFNL